ncbi:unnamed protein product [Schistosoma curassoni]|uniref:Ovule protein n=1 Tax=Schistosoma curassoni TaxID=6186 RepID=A0A183KVS4_9TREM|nr:unnamed protein product [Schistosoma curassoni]
MNLAITLSRDFKHCRFLDRLVTKDSLNLAIGTIASSDTLVRGSYRYAIGKSSYSTCFHYMVDFHCCCDCYFLLCLLIFWRYFFTDYLH